MKLEAVFNFLKSYLSPILSSIAIIVSIWSFKVARRATLYSDIDGRYLELIKLGIANPKFVNPDLTKNYRENFSDDELLKYERYAFAAWNIVETIYDRRKDEKLFKTWKPVIMEENRLHRRWLNDKENQHKFKNDFWKFIIGNEDFPCPECEKMKDVPLCPRCKELKDMAESGNEMPIIAVE